MREPLWTGRPPRSHASEARSERPEPQVVWAGAAAAGGSLWSGLWPRLTGSVMLPVREYWSGSDDSRSGEPGAVVPCGAPGEGAGGSPET